MCIFPCVGNNVMNFLKFRPFTGHCSKNALYRSRSFFVWFNYSVSLITAIVFNAFFYLFGNFCTRFWRKWNELISNVYFQFSILFYVYSRALGTKSSSKKIIWAERYSDLAGLGNVLFLEISLFAKNCRKRSMLILPIGTSC